MNYKVYIKLYKIIGLVMPWPVIMSKLHIKVQDYENVKMRFLGF
jgi:hypothetical protein